MENELLFNGEVEKMYDLKGIYYAVVIVKAQDMPNGRRRLKVPISRELYADWCEKVNELHAGNSEKKVYLIGDLEFKVSNKNE